MPFMLRTFKAELPSKNVTHILSSTNLWNIANVKMTNHKANIYTPVTEHPPCLQVSIVVSNTKIGKELII